MVLKAEGNLQDLVVFEFDQIKSLSYKGRALICWTEVALQSYGWMSL